MANRRINYLQSLTGGLCLVIAGSRMFVTHQTHILQMYGRSAKLSIRGDRHPNRNTYGGTTKATQSSPKWSQSLFPIRLGGIYSDRF